MLILPPLSDSLQFYTWRALTPEDAPAVYALLDFSARADQTMPPPEPETLRERLQTSASLGVLQGAALIACAWSYRHPHVRHERRIMVDGLVHPACRGRGIGGALLEWAELVARAEGHPADEQPAVLRIDRINPTDEQTAFYQRAGFEVFMAEDEMRFDLRQPVPDQRLDAPYTLESWTPASAPDFYAVYADAFRERPGFPDWPEETWRAALTGHDTFRADLSLLAREDGTPCAYVICHVEGGEGQIVQIGTHTGWRGQGLAGALICEALRRFQREGLDHAVLEVATNNPGAARVYARLGFARTRRTVGFRKALGPA